MTALRRRLPTVALVAALVAGAILAAVLATAGPEDDLPLSPDSTAADGTRALTEVLERLGAETVIDAQPPEEADSVLLLVDNLADDQRDALEERAEGGTTLVVVDARSPLAPEPVGAADLGFVETPIGEDCEVPALADVERVQPGGGVLFEPGEDAMGCFSRGAGSYLVAEPRGEGTLVVTGGPGWLTNAGIDDADNALLAVALLAPGGDETVGVVPPEFTAPGEGEADPLSLVPDWVWFALTQLAVAGLLLVWWRARRLGAPVVEEQPVRLPGSELVLALGGLHAARGDTTHAAATLREGVRRDAARRLGLPVDADDETVARSAVDAGAEPEVADLALRAPLPRDDDGLVALARAVEELRRSLSGPVRDSDGGDGDRPPDASAAGAGETEETRGATRV